MKQLTAIFMFILVMTTATFAGSGITATVQNRIAKVEVVDTNFYNVTVLDDTNRLIDGQPMTRRSGALTVEVPENSSYIRVLVTNIHTGVVVENIRLEIE